MSTPTKLDRITSDQFAALADLLRLRAGPAEQAAYFVLVEGRAVADAARDAGLEYRAAYQAVQRAIRGLHLARIATGVQSDHNDGA